MSAPVSQSREHEAARAAAGLVTSAGGVLAGRPSSELRGFAHHARHVASELAWTLEQLAAERSARAAVQQRADRLERLLLTRPALELEPDDPPEPGS